MLLDFFFLFMHCLYVLNSNCAKFWLQNPACHHGHHHQICGKHVAKSVTLLKAHFVLILKMHINEKKKYFEDGLHTLCLKLAKYFDNVVNSPEKSKICV